MITLKDFMETVDYKITEGSDYTWDCYGVNAYSLDSWNGGYEENGYSLSVIFDTKTQTVYELTACDYIRDRAYRFINPDYLVTFQKESKFRGVDNQAWDDVNYVDLDVKDDFLEKARAIVLGNEYDTKVSIPLDFNDEELFTLMKMAHEKDITLNQLVTDCLEAAINKESSKQNPWPYNVPDSELTNDHTQF